METTIAVLVEGQKHMEKKIDLLFTKLDHNTEISQKALDQTLKTNGRVTRLEEEMKKEEIVIKDYETNKNQIQGGIKVLYIVFGLVSLFITTFYYMYIEKKEKEWGDNIMVRLQNSNIQITAVSEKEGIYKIKLYEGK